MKTVNATTLQREGGELLNEVCYQNQVIKVVKRKRIVAYIISPEQHQLLEQYHAEQVEQYRR